MLSKSVQSVIRDALMEAHRRRHDMLTIEHVLYALTNSMRGRILLEGSGASVAVLREQLEDFFNRELEVIPLAGKHEVAQTEGVQRVLEEELDDNLFCTDLRGQAAQSRFVGVGWHANRELLAKLLGQLALEAQRRLVIDTALARAETQSVAQFVFRQALHAHQQATAVLWAASPAIDQ